MIDKLAEFAVKVVTGIADVIGKRRAAAAAQATPIRWRHVWDEWEPPPGQRKRAVPVCVFCHLPQTAANKDAACPVVSDPQVLA